MRTKLVTAEGEHRIFSIAVDRKIRWLRLLLVAILGIAQAKPLPPIIGGFELLPSLARRY